MAAALQFADGLDFAALARCADFAPIAISDDQVEGIVAQIGVEMAADIDDELRQIVRFNFWKRPVKQTCLS